MGRHHAWFTYSKSRHWCGRGSVRSYGERDMLIKRLEVVDGCFPCLEGLKLSRFEKGDGWRIGSTIVLGTKMLFLFPHREMNTYERVVLTSLNLKSASGGE